MRHPLIVALLLAGYFTRYSNSVLADTSLYYSAPQNPSSFSMQIKAGHLRIEDLSQNTRTTSLIDVEKNLLIIIDHANKKYRECKCR